MKDTKICFIVALEKECKYLLPHIKNANKTTLCDKNCYTGELNGLNVALIVCGIGKVNAAMSTQIAIDTFSPNSILNFGSAGGLNGKVKPLEFYQIEKCCQYDFDLSKIDNVPVGYIQDYDCVYFKAETTDGFLPSVSLATSDRFTSEKSDLDVVASLSCSVFDMEGCAIAQVCRANNVKCHIIKGISDVNGSEIQAEQYFKNAEAVYKGLPETIITFTEYLK